MDDEAADDISLPNSSRRPGRLLCNNLPPLLDQLETKQIGLISTSRVKKEPLPSPSYAPRKYGFSFSLLFLKLCSALSPFLIARSFVRFQAREATFFLFVYLMAANKLVDLWHRQPESSPPGCYMSKATLRIWQPVSDGFWQELLTQNPGNLISWLWALVWFDKSSPPWLPWQPAN